MNIPKNKTLIEALLMEDLPDCSETSDVELSDEENIPEEGLPSTSNFDENFEAALEEYMHSQAEPDTEHEAEDPSAEIEREVYSISNTVPDNSHPEETVASTHEQSKKKTIEPNRKWKKRDVETCLPAYSANTGVVEEHFAECTTATDIFLVLISDTLDNIVYQSNLYATQRGKILNLKKEELLAFIGMNFYMGYNTRPSWTDHYSSAPDLNNPLICKTMPRDRFAAIVSHLHCNDNTKMDSNCKDKLYKIRPFIDALNKKFQDCYYGTRELSVDESMIKFKGRSVLKQYLPMKPIKRGYKLWCLADQRGFIKNFIIYQGKNTEISLKFADYSVGEKVVLELTEKEWGKQKVIYHDNYFTSIPLLEKLKTEGTYACGTIRSNRKGIPNNLVADSKLKRGQYDYRFSNLNIAYYKWKDNKIVHLTSNFHGNDEDIVLRKEKNGSKSTITCPKAIKDYNSYMGGVDTADRLRALYCIDRKSPKWWHRLFWGILDIAFVNAHIIHGLIMEKTSVIDFRRSVAQGLMSMKDIKDNKKRLSRDSVPSPGPSKRRKTGFSTLKDVRLGNRGVHWPMFVPNRGRCEVCSMKKVQSKPHSKCSHCNIFLCINEKKNCFAEYHNANV